MKLEASCLDKSEKKRHRPVPLKIIALAATMAVLFWSIQVSAYPLHNGEYTFWSEMPQAMRVLTDMKGKERSGYGGTAACRIELADCPRQRGC